MRISTRLALLLGATFAVIMLFYAGITLQQRVQLLRGALIAETETLAGTLRIVTDNALRDRRFRDLSRVFGEVVADPETVVAAVTDPRGRVIVGATGGDPACLRLVVPRGPVGSGGARGWADCGMRVRWVVLPAAAPAGAVVLARRATVIEHEVAATRRRLLLLTLALVTAAAGIVHGVLRRTLSLPLAEILRGIRSLGGQSPPLPIRVPPSAGELHELAGAFNAMAAELDERERRLREAEKFAVIGRVSGGLAHELGSPLAVIAMRADAVGAEPGATPAARRNAEAIASEVDRITRLVEGLLYVGRRRGIEPAPLDLRPVVREVVASLAPAGEAAGVEVEVREPDAPVVVRGQATLLRHVVLNLARNAIQALATGPRGGRRIAVRVEEGGGEVRVVVEDNGPGIAPEHLARVFEPFFTTKEVGEGAGLGLAVSRGIVEEHGGELRVESTGAGVRAVVTLPAAGEPAGAGAP
ncbi:MAG TPA: ATP-binding protein [Longimicrobiaceae bacterium]|jgi:signal transduction histidine kinase